MTGRGSVPVVLGNPNLIYTLRFVSDRSVPFGPALTALIASFIGFFRSRAALQLEILAPRHQIGVLERSVKRPKLTSADRLLWAWLGSVWRDWRSGIHIVQASTVGGWHLKGVRLLWT